MYYWCFQNKNAASISQVIKITSAETLANFHQAIQCYIWEDGIFLSIQLLFNIELCLQNFWCKVALLAIDLPLGPVLSTKLVFLNMQGCDWPSDNTLLWLGLAFRRIHQVRNLLLQEFHFGTDHLPIRGSTFWLSLKVETLTTGQTPAEGNFFPNG